jgi:hypothetical protein
MQDFINIPLGEFGFDGAVTMSKPTFRRVNEARNAISNVTKLRRDGTANVIERTNIGDIAIINVLAYVRTSPFPPTLEGFLDFCDVLDDASIGSAQKLWDRMSDAVEKIEAGDTSPFADSPTQEKESSA